MIASCHAQICVGVVTYIGAYHLLSAYYPSTYCYKRMRILTRFYGTLDFEYTINREIFVVKMSLYGVAGDIKRMTLLTLMWYGVVCPNIIQ